MLHTLCTRRRRLHPLSHLNVNSGFEFHPTVLKTDDIRILLEVIEICHCLLLVPQAKLIALLDACQLYILVGDCQHVFSKHLLTSVV
jgi:hypothetical protein